MSTIGEEANKLKSHVTEYANHRIELVKLEALEKVAELSANLSSSLIFFFLILSFVMFGLTSLSLTLGEIWESYALGFSAVTGLVLGMLMVGLIFRKAIVKRPIQNMFVRLLFKNWKSDA